METVMKYGIISDVDPAKGYVRVSFTDEPDGEGGTMVSDWIPFLVRGSLENKDTFTFSINEHVVCLMDEYCDSGVVLGAIYNNVDTPDGAGEDIFRKKFKDGSSIEFNAGTGLFTVDIKGDANINVDGDANINVGGNLVAAADGDLELHAGSTLKIVANQLDIDAPTISITGDITLSGDIAANGVQSYAVTLATHTHNDISSGGITGPPNP